MEASYDAGESPPPPHYHPSQDEHFEVLEGAIALKVGHERSVVPAGESFDIPRGVAHSLGPADGPARAALRTLRTGEADAYFAAPDGMVISQAALVVEVMRERQLPAMFAEPESVAKGGLASYAVSYYTLGRLAAKDVQRILLGANPGDLPVEQFDRLHLVINLKTAKALGLTIPPSLLQRADQVIDP